MARWCSRHRTIVLVLWLVALAGSFGASRAAGTSFSTQFQLPDTQSGRALSLLAKDFPAASGSSDQIVLHATAGPLRDPAVKARAQRMLRQVAVLPHVRAVASPFSAAGAGQVSGNATVAFATVSFDQQSQSLPKAVAQQVITTAEAAGGGQLQVALGGQDIENAQSQGSSTSTLAGIVLALAVLGVAFGALFGIWRQCSTARQSISAVTVRTSQSARWLAR